LSSSFTDTDDGQENEEADFIKDPVTGCETTCDCDEPFANANEQTHTRMRKKDH
jgi:hypothetical protein